MVKVENSSSFPAFQHDEGNHKFDVSMQKVFDK